MMKKNDNSSFGTRLSALRNKEGMSLEDLAAQVGLKPAYLARLEADQVLPPVAEIIRLARTLAVEPSAFIGPDPDKAVSGKRREAMARRTDDYAYQNLTPDEHDMHLMAFKVTIDPKSEHHQVGYQHVGEEFVYVLSGKLKIAVGRKTASLGPGQTIHFDSGQKHKLSNPGREPTALVVVIYTP